MIRAGSSSTQVTLGSSIDLDGHIIKSERSHRLYEETNSILRLRDIWLLVDSPLLRGCEKFFKLEHNSERRKGNKIIKVEFSRDYYMCVKLETLQQWKREIKLDLYRIR